MRTTITIQDLIDADACRAQQKDFLDRWPDGKVDVTVDGARAAADCFDWGWAARYLLPAPAQTQYDAVIQAMWAEHYAALKAARAQWDASTDSDSDSAYQSACDALWDQTDITFAVAFAEAALAFGIDVIKED